MIKRLVFCFLLLIAGVNGYSQVKSIMLDGKDMITQDSTLAATYAVFGKITGDSVYSFKKFDFDGVLLASGSFKDDSLRVPHGNFTYYAWITPENNTVNYGYEIKGKERFVSVTGKFVDGLQTGRWISFYPDGKMKQVVTYYKGIIHGAFQAFDQTGKMQVSGVYVSGKKQGVWKLDGGKQENTYVHDELISSLRGKKLRDKQAQSQNSN
jgi:hypothetical protein